MSDASQLISALGISHGRRHSSQCVGHAEGVAWSDTVPTPPAHHIKEAVAGMQTELQQLALHQTVLCRVDRGSARCPARASLWIQTTKQNLSNDTQVNN